MDQQIMIGLGDGPCRQRGDLRNPTPIAGVEGVQWPEGRFALLGQIVRIGQSHGVRLPAARADRVDLPALVAPFLSGSACLEVMFIGNGLYMKNIELQHRYCQYPERVLFR